MARWKWKVAIDSLHSNPPKANNPAARSHLTHTAVKWKWSWTSTQQWKGVGWVTGRFIASGCCRIRRQTRQRYATLDCEYLNFNPANCSFEYFGVCRCCIRAFCFRILKMFCYLSILSLFVQTFAYFAHKLRVRPVASPGYEKWAHNNTHTKYTVEPKADISQFPLTFLLKTTSKLLNNVVNFV